VADRLRVNKLALKVASWVASAMRRRVELWDDNLIPQSPCGTTRLNVSCEEMSSLRFAGMLRLALRLQKASAVGGFFEELANTTHEERSSSSGLRLAEQKETHNTSDSHLLPNGSTKLARRGLASVFERVPAFSSWYDRA
jgi:hypothetical protein